MQNKRQFLLQGKFREWDRRSACRRAMFWHRKYFQILLTQQSLRNEHHNGLFLICFQELLLSDNFLLDPDAVFLRVHKFYIFAMEILSMYSVHFQPVRRKNGLIQKQSLNVQVLNSNLSCQKALEVFPKQFFAILSIRGHLRSMLKTCHES